MDQREREKRDKTRHWERPHSVTERAREGTSVSAPNMRERNQRAREW